IPFAPPTSTPLGAQRTCYHWRKRPMMSDPWPRVSLSLTVSLSSPMLWKTPAATTPTSWGTCAAPAPMCAAAGPWTCCSARSESVSSRDQVLPQQLLKSFARHEAALVEDAARGDEVARVD